MSTSPLLPPPLPAKFLTPLHIDDGNGTLRTLLEPFKFYSAELGRVVKVDPGFQTDFASIPRGVYNIFPKDGLWDKPAVLHDAAYTLQLKDLVGRPLLLSKAQADALFREGLEVVGVGTVTRTLMYWAVTLFGKGDFAALPPR